MPEGRIVKAISGFYYVADEDRVVQCRARGLFKKKDRKVTPLVGDWVVYDPVSETEGYIMEVDERTTELIRPPIANVDQAVLVFALREPSFSSVLLDKFLAHSEHAGLDAVIVLSKADLAEPSEIGAMQSRYERIGYQVIPTSTLDKRGIEEVRQVLSGRLSVFAGQSGVGKSSLLNELFPGIRLETGEVSHRLGRGRHTTRHVELLPLPEGGYVADTPGFSSLDFIGMTEADLARSFLDFRRLSGDCRFRGCLHLTEPGCAVRAALEVGELDAERYEHYQQFMDELKDYQRRNRPW